MTGGTRIGILGGSFNPAHEGHLHISHQAMRILDLDCVWWVVSPQNPLKSADGMAPFNERLYAARVLSKDRRILITDLEARLGTRFTVDTITEVVRCFPDKHFVWIMGADNLSQLPRWKNWHSLFGLIPIAIFDRAPYSAEALSGKAAGVYASRRHANRDSRRLIFETPPAWNFFHTSLHPASATQIRAEKFVTHKG